VPEAFFVASLLRCFVASLLRCFVASLLRCFVAQLFISLMLIMHFLRSHRVCRGQPGVIEERKESATPDLWQQMGDKQHI
jgi:hypothetical protein